MKFMLDIHQSRHDHVNCALHLFLCVQIHCMINRSRTYAVNCHVNFWATVTEFKSISDEKKTIEFMELNIHFLLRFKKLPQLYKDHINSRLYRFSELWRSRRNCSRNTGKNFWHTLHLLHRIANNWKKTCSFIDINLLLVTTSVTGLQSLFSWPIVNLNLNL